MLTVDDITIAYDAIDAVKGVSLNVGEGEAVCVLGPNGAGKTTLVRAIAGWQRPRVGCIHFDGADITSWKPWQRTRRGLGVMPEGGRIFSDLTVEENLRVAGGRDWESGLELFPALGEHRRRSAGSLSGGQRQMLALSRALTGNPRLLVVDEVSFGLMPQAVDEIFAKLRDLKAHGTTMLIIEQREDQALNLCERGYVMGNGHILAEGDRRELASDALRRLYLEGA